jgi:hypothetical protein
MPIILVTQEAEIKKTTESSQTPSKPIKSYVVVCACHSTYRGYVNRRITVQVSGGINVRH